MKFNRQQLEEKLKEIINNKLEERKKKDKLKEKIEKVIREKCGYKHKEEIKEQEESNLDAIAKKIYNSRKNDLDDIMRSGEYNDEEKRQILSKLRELENGNLDEKSPPGREDQVKTLKKELPKTYVDKETGKRKESSPYAVSWASYNKSKGK